MGAFRFSNENPGLKMIFMAKVCLLSIAQAPKAINFAIAESIHQLLVLKPHPIAQLDDLCHDLLCFPTKIAMKYTTAKCYLPNIPVR